MKAQFTKEGPWRKIETKIEMSDLPAAVSKTIAADYANEKVNSITKLEKPKNLITYETEMQHDSTFTDISFTPDGKMYGKVIH